MSNHIDPKIQEIEGELINAAGEELILDAFDVITRKMDGKIIAEVFDSDHAIIFADAAKNLAYLLSEYKRLQSENQGMKEALEWYADEEKYTRSEEDYMIGYPPEIRFDQGRKAREALSHLKGE